MYTAFLVDRKGAILVDVKKKKKKKKPRIIGYMLWGSIPLFAGSKKGIGYERL